ncbi:MAG TPA: hypothetical protein VFC96_00340 [Anaerovoracaceae bacterium]|nr:hypothetical protein [Anaerovoracaceae bacterium]
MNKTNVTVLIVALALIVTTVMVGATGYEPGSSEDPVVTKSYVDSQIEAIRKSETSPSTFTPVFVTAGKKLIGGEGTELILRSGGALAVAKGADGLSDVTEGKDLNGGFAVTKNHLLLIPRDDGRGISAATDIWVMVKGTYFIE